MACPKVRVRVFRSPVFFNSPRAAGCQHAASPPHPCVRRGPLVGRCQRAAGGVAARDRRNPRVDTAGSWHRWQDLRGLLPLCGALLPGQRAAARSGESRCRRRSRRGLCSSCRIDAQKASMPPSTLCSRLAQVAALMDSMVATGRIKCLLTYGSQVRTAAEGNWHSRLSSRRSHATPRRACLLCRAV